MEAADTGKSCDFQLSLRRVLGRAVRRFCCLFQMTILRVEWRMDRVARMGGIESFWVFR